MLADDDVIVGWAVGFLETWIARSTPCCWAWSGWQPRLGSPAGWPPATATTTTLWCCWFAYPTQPSKCLVYCVCSFGLHSMRRLVLDFFGLAPCRCDSRGCRGLAEFVRLDFPKVPKLANATNATLTLS